VPGDEHGVAGRSGRGVDPRSDVDRVADHRELESSGAADVAGDHGAGAEADAGRELRSKRAGDRLLDLERGRQRPLDMVGLAARANQPELLCPVTDEDCADDAAGDQASRSHVLCLL